MDENVDPASMTDEQYDAYMAKLLAGQEETAAANAADLAVFQADADAEVARVQARKAEYEAMNAKLTDDLNRINQETEQSADRMLAAVRAEYGEEVARHRVDEADEHADDADVPEPRPGTQPQARPMVEQSTVEYRRTA